VARESKKQAAKRPKPPLPRAGSHFGFNCEKNGYLIILKISKLVFNFTIECKLPLQNTEIQGYSLFSLLLLYILIRFQDLLMRFAYVFLAKTPSSSNTLF